MDEALQFTKIVTDYFISLDWTFILTFIVISYFFLEKIKLKKTNVLSRISKTWKVLFIGFAWGCIIYYLRDYTRKDIEMMAASLFTGMVVHSAVVYWLIQWFNRLMTKKE